MNRRRVMRSALLTVVLSMGVIVGLLGMHGFDTHGSQAHGTPQHSAVGAHEMDADQAGLAATEAAVADTEASGAMGVICVLALLTGILLVLSPRRGLLPPSLTARLQPWVLLRTARPARPPSLVVLCISRT